MSNQGPGRPRTTTKPRRLAKREAAQRAAAARRRAHRRRQLIRMGGAAAAVLAVVLLVFVACGGLGRHKAASPSASASAAPSASAAASFPPLPPGADPALATKPTVGAGTGTLAKLVVTPLIEGKGDPVRSGQSVTVNYVGATFKDGKEFDSSWKRSQAFPFTIGSGQVIAGWDQGLVGVKVGSRVQLDIPANLAYGDNPTGGQPAGPLRFVVDVLAAQ
jgi:peptidylprolyl isomerase